MTDKYPEDGGLIHTEPQDIDIVERLRDMSMALCGGSLHRPMGSKIADEAADEIERLRETLQEIEQWSRAYPLSIFPKPDLKRAHELLQAGDMTLDAISADTMRHVVEGVGAIARRALEPKP